ncbi:unnamed protein product (mitochondrion) [Plasmodiophora brassicae]|uniref:Uncharacterized protein n=1 Tax=Plasmodiophora brassicae TaxID=37360 RepID=A0A0G4J011_PLABS|nr:hypothetical protein PBRA_001723 [Plasmodiophora brassicae]SPQ93845.1 unnamed protein product [Plasmodiophora brassicae]
MIIDEEPSPSSRRDDASLGFAMSIRNFMHNTSAPVVAPEWIAQWAAWRIQPPSPARQNIEGTTSAAPPSIPPSVLYLCIIDDM